ncbi:MAG TPA: hypothetical protein VHQ47_16110 [Phycisphaerae bacterium]|nr:hypothetical protein [Phycisphaerae bacterium]
MRRLPHILLLWAAMVFLARTSRAAFTPESLTAVSPTIIRGTLTATVETSSDSFAKPVPHTVFTIIPKETLRAPANFPPTGPIRLDENPAPDGLPPGTPLLVCIDAYQRPILLIPLAGPDALNTVGDEFPDLIVSLDLQPLSAPQLLDALRALAHRPTAPITAVSSPAFIFDPPIHSIYIPVDDTLLPTLHRWLASSNPNARLLAVDLLGQHEATSPPRGLFGRSLISLPSNAPAAPITIPDRDALLRYLLSDPYLVNPSNDVNPFTPARYIIREAALDSLLTPQPTVFSTPSGPSLFSPVTAAAPPPLPPELAALRESTVLTAPNSRYHRFPFAWPLVLVIAFSIGVYVFARRRRWRLRFALLLLPTYAVLLLLAYRSTFIADDFLWARKPFCLSLTSYDGGIQLVASTHFPGSTPLAHTAIVPVPTVGDAMSYSDLYLWHHFGTFFQWSERATTPVRRLSFGARDMTDPTAANGISEPTAILSNVPYLLLPYSDLLYGASLLLLLSLIPLLPERLRRRRTSPAPSAPALG